MTAKLNEQRERGAQADQILNHPLVKEAFERIEKTITAEWKNEEDPDARERLHMLMQSSELFKEQFIKMIGDGNAAAQELTRLEKLKEGAKNIVRNMKAA